MLPGWFFFFGRFYSKKRTQEVWPLAVNLSTNQSAPHESAPWITFTAKRRVMKFRTFCVQNPDCWLRIHLMRWLTSSSTISLLAALMLRRSGLVHTKINKYSCNLLIVFLSLGLSSCHHLIIFLALITRWFLWNYPALYYLPPTPPPTHTHKYNKKKHTRTNCLNLRLVFWSFVVR